MRFLYATQIAALLMVGAMLVGCGLTDDEKKDGGPATGFTTVTLPR